MSQPFRFGDRRDWFFEKRFGLFVHWGLYAIPGWAEQDQYRRAIPRSRYEKLAGRFNPVRFNPDAWLDTAEDAGMRYVCFTTKHIDGFCLWDTKQTPYNVMNTPYKRDVLALLAEACRRRKFPLCLYYSIPDMHHPNYPHAGRSYELPQAEPGDEPNLEKYLAFVRAQIEELCTGYGEIGGWWWDANVLRHADPSFNALIRSRQPGAVINNRGFEPPFEDAPGGARGGGDFSTPEREGVAGAQTVRAFTRPVEACQAIGIESWGYRKDEDYFSNAQLIRSIDQILARGGNYLLNVGPKADGTFPPQALRILRAIGKWYRSVRESFEGTQPDSSLTTNPDVLVTRRENTFYVHLAATPAGDRVLLPPVSRLPRETVLLNTGRPVRASVDQLPENFASQERPLRLARLPVNKLAGEVMVIRLVFPHP